MIIFNYNVLSVNRFKKKKKRNYYRELQIRFCDITYLHCGVTSIQYYLLISQQSIYSYNKIEYHIIINDNTKQFTISQSLKSCGCGKDFKNLPYMGMAAICCRNSFNIFCQRVKNGFHIKIFCDYQSKFDLAAKKSRINQRSSFGHTW